MEQIQECCVAGSEYRASRTKQFICRELSWNIGFNSSKTPKSQVSHVHGWSWEVWFQPRGWNAKEKGTKGSLLIEGNRYNCWDSEKSVKLSGKGNLTWCATNPHIFMANGDRKLHLLGKCTAASLSKDDPCDTKDKQHKRREPEEHCLQKWPRHAGI